MAPKRLGALGTAPGERNQPLAIAAVEDLAHGAHIALEQLHRGGHQLVYGAVAQLRKIAQLGQLAETLHKVQALGLAVSGKMMGDERPVRAVGEGVARADVGGGAALGEAQQQAGAAHNALIGGERTIKEVAAHVAVGALGHRLGDQGAPEVGAVDHHEPLLAKGGARWQGHKLHPGHHGRLHVGLAVHGDAATVGGELRDAALMEAEE